MNLSPPAEDVLLFLLLPHSGTPTPHFLQIDKLANGSWQGYFRASFGTLFELVEVHRCRDLEQLLRAAHRLHGTRNGHDAQAALIAMRTIP